MSIEQKIKEMLERVEAKQIDEAAVDLSAQGLGADGAAASAQAQKDPTLKPATAGDTTQPTQGSSEKASSDSNEQEEQGKKQAAAAKKDTSLSAANAGDTTQPKQGGSQAASWTEIQSGHAEAKPVDSHMNAAGAGDATSPAQGSSKITVPEEVDVRSELDSIFGEELSEEFRTKATSIFEAAVVARVNSEVGKLMEEIETATAEEIASYKEGLVEKVDAYLSYVVENWMSENEVAIENGLRTEVAEDFIQGLKGLFKEHYIEVPEEKYDVIGELQAKTEELEAKLDEAINSNVELTQEVTELKRKEVFEESVKGMAATEAEKLAKLVEGVEFESADLYKEKLSVIKENYFPKVTGRPAEQTLTEDVTTSVPNLTNNDTIAAYAQALSRSVKR